MSWSSGIDDRSPSANDRTVLTSAESRARELVELDAVSAELLDVVHQTLGPASTTLWLQAPSDRGDFRSHRARRY